jgi:putative peptide zinc metalloprotease protein
MTTDVLSHVDPVPSAAPGLLDWRPERRPEVRLGPGLLRGAAVVHLVKDGRNGRRYEIGAREYFVLSRLDGMRSLAEIGEAYTARFSRRLNQASWGQLIGLFAAKDLLVSTTERPVAPPPAPVEEAKPGNRLWRGERVFGRPARLIAHLLRYQRILFSPLLWVPLALVLVAQEVILASHFAELTSQSRAMFEQPELALIVFCLLWVSSGLHEVGHGVVATHFGGGTGNVGVAWRLPFVYLYCEVEDVNLFVPRWQRIATASAGVAVNLTFLLPFFALWWLLPDGDATRTNVGALLLLGSMRALFNLLPVPPLDGYHILGHLMNLLHLAAESRRYLRSSVLALVGRAERPRRYPRFTPVVYLGYGVFQLLVRLAILVALVWYFTVRLPSPVGLIAGSVLVLLIAARFVGLKMRDRMARQDDPTRDQKGSRQ